MRSANELLRVPLDHGAIPRDLAPRDETSVADDRIEILEELVMNKLERLAEELRALGIAF